ncbi:hypothetical protein ALQ97_200132 [Pseudomonas savastanoi pv. glycinea]|nr:hypothetical protein ALQ97_200132 [Pseudomonas savastanoi pv. glycinea]
MQLLEHPGQFLDGDMKQHGVGEDPVEAFAWQVQLQEILLPHFAAAVLACHSGEFLRAVEAHRNVPHAGKCLQIPPRAAAEIENVKGGRALDMPQQRVDVLADVVIASAFAKALGDRVVMAQGRGGNGVEVVGGVFHGEA